MSPGISRLSCSEPPSLSCARSSTSTSPSCEPVGTPSQEGCHMAAKVELTPEEARNWRLAKLFDLRTFIGSLFLIFGILVTIPGIAASQATINKAADINLALWVGVTMLVIAVFFLSWVLLKPPAPITTAEAEAARKAREEFGTQGPGHH